MTSAEQEISAAIEELKKFVSLAVQPRVKNALNKELRQLETELARSKPNSATPTVTSSEPPLPVNKITTYGWDQSDQYVKLYVTVPGAKPEDEKQVEPQFSNKSVEFVAKNIGGKNHTLTVKGLLYPIVPESSSCKVKKDLVLLMLKKQAAKSWSYVTEAEHRSKDKKPEQPKVDNSGDPNVGLMSLMKQMYDDGDDEMKRTINKAWCEAQEKKKTGGGDLDAAGMF